MQAYGKLMITPTLRHPVQAFLYPFIRYPFVSKETEEQQSRVGSDTARKVMEWALDGDRVAPEMRPRLEAALLSYGAHEEATPEQ